jgi:Outer membrane protein beta-barrel domain
MSRPIRLFILSCAVAGFSGTAVADDLLGIYAGAGVGRSSLQQDDYQISSNVTGWKLLAGWRPISLLGVEVEYADLGSKSINTYAGSTHVSTDGKATAAFVLGYLPVPLPWIDLYGKVGAAHVKTDTNAYPNPGFEGSPSSLDNSKSSIAWGGGLQFKAGHWAARVDYERFDGSQGNPSLLSAEGIFNF